MPLTIIETRLGELIAKIDANDREIDYLNSQMLPTGAERLRSAELVAREVEAWRVNQAGVVRITRELCLPTWSWSEGNRVTEDQRGLRVLERPRSD